jgi:hypothetical protein
MDQSCSLLDHGSAPPYRLVISSVSEEETWRVLETKFANQKGETVLRSRATLIETGQVVQRE